MFIPKSIVCLREGYTREQLLRDVIAGVVVGIVALPLALAFAIASGVPPERGLYTAIIAGFLISAFGGSRVAIGGPTGAFVVIVYGILQQYGPGNLMICTIMAGVILLVMGFAQLGTMIKYIPYPVTVGFTCGIAVLILSTQIKDFFGLHLDKPVPSDFVEKMLVFGRNVRSISWPTAALGLFSVVLILI